MARPTWIATAVLAAAAAVAFAAGRDDWGRSVREPTADAAYYYAYLPSLVLDGDLDFANQYRVTGNWYRLGPTPLGRPGNVFGIGPAVFALPAFAIGHGLAIATGARRDGFSGWETGLVLAMSVAASLGAMLLAARLAQRRVGSAAAGYAGAVTAAVAGPLLYYAIRQPGYAHPFAALFATLLIERWDASYTAPRTLRTWLVLGAAAGAAALARPQLALWGLLLVAAAVDDVRRRARAAATSRASMAADGGARDALAGSSAMNGSTARLVARWAAGAAVAVAVLLPQLVAWQRLYGAWYVVPQGPGFLRWDAPAWSEALWSSRNGLLPWAPLYAVMLIGVLCVARRGMRLPLALLLGLFGQALVNGAAWDWWAGGSFGGRRFDSCYAVFAVGAAALIAAACRALGRRGAVRWLAGLGLAAAALIAAATVELAGRTSVNSARIGGGEAASEIWRREIGGVRGWLAAVLSRAANAPARAAFAWRYGVGLDAYDRRVGVYVLGETYPGLNSYPDKLRDTLAAPGAIGGSPLRVLVGLNRRGRVALHIPVSGSGPVAVRWNGGSGSADSGSAAADEASADIVGHGSVELGGLVPRRGINTLEIRGAPGLVVGAIEITAAP